MNKLTCILVDDELHCLDLLQKMITVILKNELEIIGTFTKPLEALAFINNNKPDILFCDIEMPKLTGIELVNTLEQHDIIIVFTTAYTAYALDAIKVAAVDYMVKPFGTEELLDAYARIKKRIEIITPLTTITPPQLPIKIKVHLANTESIYIDSDQIIYIEAHSNYSTLHVTNGQKHVISKTLKEFDEMLQKHNFFRTHHSYLVNLKYVESIKGGEIDTIKLVNNNIAYISRRRKTEFLNRIKM